MKILFFGDLAATGFGSVTTDLGQAMLDRGLDVRFVSQNDTGSNLPEPFRSRTVDLVSLPWAVNRLSGQAGTTGPAEGLREIIEGTSTALLHSGEPAGGWTPDACIVLGDPGAATIFMDTFGSAFREVPTYHYVPIEGVGLPPAWRELWTTMAPVACSQFGADQIAKVTGIRPPVVYHGIDTDMFRPVSKARPLLVPGQQNGILNNRDECKQSWLSWLATENNTDRIPRHWILRTDSHWPRKRYNSMIRALTPVLARHPDWAMVIHGNPRGPGGDLRHTLSKVPQRIRSQFLLTNAWSIPREALTVLYNASDLYVSTGAEGFGLTIAEALACGVPAVGCDYASVPEVIGPAGKVVTSYPLDNEYDHFWCAIDEDEFARTVEYLMTHKTKRTDLGRRGPGHVRANFRWDLAARDFVSIMETSMPAKVAV
jgi:glycosyltransferase involved in cell wall biosynthesis